MDGVIYGLFWATFVIWVGLEIWLRLRRPRTAEHAKPVELASLIVIFGSVLAGFELARFFMRHVDVLSISGLGWPLGLISLFVIWAGISLRVWAVYMLGEFFRPVVAIQSGHRVISTGPYRYIRHPAYAGMLVVLIGVGLRFGNLASLAAVVLVPLIGFSYRVWREESALFDQLGDAYSSYAEHTARLIPGLW
jgi:protein-S-isoprenylcysteine O-methyltransferase Ste14